MAKSSNQKLKLLYLLQILQERTDDEHGLSMQEIIAALGKYDIEAEEAKLDIEGLVDRTVENVEWIEG